MEGIEIENIKKSFLNSEKNSKEVQRCFKTF